MLFRSIIIPAYNEEKRIKKTLKAYGDYFEQKKKEKILEYEILVVINNTKDKTEEVIKKIQIKNKRIKYLNFKKGGKGFAITEGFKDALKKNFDIIGFVDADFATEPEDFYELVKGIKIFDGTIASRWIKGSIVKTKQTILRRILSRGFNLIVRGLFLFPYGDTQCGAKVFRKEAIKSIIHDLRLTEWAFDINLLYLLRKKGFRVKEIPTIWEDKLNSNIDLAKTPIQMFLSVFRLRIINSPFEPVARQLKTIAHKEDKLINKKKASKN